MASAAGSRRRQWKGALTGRGNDSPGAVRFRGLRCALDGGAGAGKDDLAGRVIVGDLADLALRRFGGYRLRGFEFEAEHGDHGAFADGDRLLHRLAAAAQQARGVGDGERPGGGEGGILPQRMAGDESADRCGFEAGLGLQHADNGERDRHEGGLRVFGEGEGFRRAVEDDTRKAQFKGVVDFLEDLPCSREGVMERLSHPDLLRPLTGERQCPRHRRSSPPPVAQRIARGVRLSSGHRDFPGAASLSSRHTARRPSTGSVPCDDAGGADARNDRGKSAPRPLPRDGYPLAMGTPLGNG